MPLKSLVAKALFAATLAGLPAAPQAQTVSEVKFASGTYGAMVSGTITGPEYIDYRLGANAGQEMYIELSVADSNGSGTVYFNVLPPGSTGEAIYNSSINGNVTTVKLPKKGTYSIRVYHMGNDADTGKTSGFNMDLSIQ